MAFSYPTSTKSLRQNPRWRFPCQQGAFSMHLSLTSHIEGFENRCQFWFADFPSCTQTKASTYAHMHRRTNKQTTDTGWIYFNHGCQKCSVPPFPSCTLCFCMCCTCYLLCAHAWSLYVTCIHVCVRVFIIHKLLLSCESRLFIFACELIMYVRSYSKSHAYLQWWMNIHIRVAIRIQVKRQDRITQSLQICSLCVSACIC
jgi:hypothetical protein